MNFSQTWIFVCLGMLSACKSDVKLDVSGIQGRARPEVEDDSVGGGGQSGGVPHNAPGSTTGTGGGPSAVVVEPAAGPGEADPRSPEDDGDDDTGPGSANDTPTLALIPVLSIIDASAPAGYSRTRVPTVVIANPPGETVLWCLSEFQALAPVSANDTCAGGVGPDRGWSTAPPTNFPLSPGDGIKTVYLWVAKGGVVVNVANPVEARIKLDETPPNEPTAIALTAPSLSPNQDTTPTFTVTASEVGLGVSLYTDANCILPTFKGSASSATTTLTVTSTALGDGPFAFHATVTDPAGNTSPCSDVSQSYTVDTVVPSPPSGWTISSPALGASSPDPTPQIAGTGLTAENGSSVTIYRDSGCSLPVGGAVIAAGVFAVTNIAFAVDGSSDGNVAFFGRIEDQVGHVSAGCTDLSLGYTLDTIAPAAPSAWVLAAPANGSLSKNVAPQVSGSGLAPEAAGSVLLYRDSLCTTQIGSAAIVAGGTFVISNVSLPTDGSADGAVAFFGKIRDAASNASACTNLSLGYTLDTMLPSAPTGWTIASPANGAISNDSTPELSGVGLAAENGGTAYVYLTVNCDTPVGSAAIAGGAFTTGNVSLPVNGSADGVLAFYGKIHDQAGNASSGCPSLGLGYTFLTQPPATPTVSVRDPLTNSATITYSANATLAITNDAAADRWCVYQQVDSAAAPAKPSSADGCFVTPRPTTVVLTTAGGANRKVYVFTRDAALNVSAVGTSNAITYTTNTVPDAVNDAGPFEVRAGQSLDLTTLLVNDTDGNSDALTISAITQGSKGSVAILSGLTSVRYTANAGTTGSDTFTYTAADGRGGTDTATVTVTIYTSFTWTGNTGDGDWSNGGNWVGSAAPGVNDVAMFNSICNDVPANCAASIDGNISVKGISISSTYPSTITQEAGRTVTLGTNGYAQDGGTFVGTDADITVGTAGSPSSFTLSAGSFTSTSAILTVKGNFTHSGGTFVHNNGTVFLGNINNNVVVSSASGTAFYDVNFVGGHSGNDSAGTWITLATGTTLTVARDLSMQNTVNSGTVYIAGGAIDVARHLTIDDDVNHEYDDVTLITMVGAQTATITSTVTLGNGMLPHLKIDKAGGTVTTSAEVFARRFTLAQGIFTAPSTRLVTHPFGGEASFTVSGGTYQHNSGALTIFHTADGSGSAIIDVDGSLSLYDLQYHWDGIPSGDTRGVTIANGDTLNVARDFTMLTMDEGGIQAWGGTINVGRYVIAGHGSRGGTTVIRMNGSSDQFIFASGSAHLPVLEIAKATGEVLPSDATVDFTVSRLILTQGAFTAPPGTLKIRPDPNDAPLVVTSGTFDHNDGVVEFDPASYDSRSHTINVNSSITFASLRFSWSEAGGSSYSRNFNLSGDTLIVLGDVHVGTSSGHIILDSGTINVKGNVYLGSGADGGTASLTFSGTVDQYYAAWDGGTPVEGTVTVAMTAAKKLFLASPLVLSGTAQALTLTTGRIDMQGHALTVAGQCTFAAATIVERLGGTISCASQSGTGTINNTAPGAFTWTGGGANTNWATGGNWYGGTAPNATTQVAIFNGVCAANCTAAVAADMAVGGVRLLNPNAVITQGSGRTIDVGPLNWIQHAGTFTGGNANFTVDEGGMLLGGGTLTSTSATLGFATYNPPVGAPLLAIKAVDFVHANGLIDINVVVDTGPQNYNIVFGTKPDLYKLTVRSGTVGCCGQGPAFVFAGSARLEHDLTLGIGPVNDNGVPELVGGLLEVERNVILTPMQAYDHATVISFVGDAAQTFSVSNGVAGWGDDEGPVFAMDKATATSIAVAPAPGTTSLFLAGFFGYSGNFVAPSGTLRIHLDNYSSLYFDNSSWQYQITAFAFFGGQFDAGTGTVRILPRVDDDEIVAHMTVSPDLAFNNLTLDAGSENGAAFDYAAFHSVTYSWPITVAGNLTLTSKNADTSAVYNGTFRVLGNVLVNHANFGGGTCKLTFAGGGAQTLTVSAGDLPSGLMKIDKTGGSVALTTAVDAGQHLTVSQGTLNMAGHNLDVPGTLTNNGTITKGGATLSYGSLTGTGTINP